MKRLKHKRSDEISSWKYMDRYGHAGVVIQGLLKNKTKNMHKKWNIFSKEPVIAQLDFFICMEQSRIFPKQNMQNFHKSINVCEKNLWDAVVIVSNVRNCWALSSAVLQVKKTWTNFSQCTTSCQHEEQSKIMTWISFRAKCACFSRHSDPVLYILLTSTSPKNRCSDKIW